MNAQINFAVIINSFNRRELLKSALESLSKTFPTVNLQAAILVFEAGSTDGSLELLEAWKRQHPEFPTLIVKPSPGDGTSFSDGINAACSSAIRQLPSLKWLLLFETDNWVADAAPIQKAIRVLEKNSSLAATGFTVRRHSGEYCGFGMSFPSATGFVLGQQLCAKFGIDVFHPVEWNSTQEIDWFECDVVFTSPLLIRGEAWEQIGPFDATFFPFSDSDLDWAWRANRKGWKLAVIRSDAVVHDNLTNESEWSANRTMDLHRSRLRLLKRYRGGWIALLKPFLFLRHLIEFAALSILVMLGRRKPQRVTKRLEMLRSVWRNYAAS